MVRSAYRIALAGLMRARVGIVRAFRVTGIGGLYETEIRRAAVDRDRPDGQVRPGGTGRVRPFEIKAERSEALSCQIRQHDVRAGLESVARGVVHEMNVGVHAAVATV